jgi:hypothetical protein
MQFANGNARNVDVFERSSGSEIRTPLYIVDTNNEHHTRPQGTLFKSNKDELGSIL